MTEHAILGTADLSQCEHEPSIKTNKKNFDLCFKTDRNEVIITLNEKQLIDLFHHTSEAVECFTEHKLPYHV